MKVRIVCTDLATNEQYSEIEDFPSVEHARDYYSTAEYFDYAELAEHTASANTLAPPVAQPTKENGNVQRYD